MVFKCIRLIFMRLAGTHQQVCMVRIMKYLCMIRIDQQLIESGFGREYSVDLIRTQYGLCIHHHSNSS